MAARNLLPTLDIHGWTEEHVHFWMQQIFGTDQAACGMQRYADLFKENHITGRRLLLLTEADMRDMGVKSKGHIIHLKSEIEKLTNDYLGLLHFPPLMKDEWAEDDEEERKTVDLELVFGLHWKPGTGPSDCKWKMYMELDGDEVAITYIRDVTFNPNRPDVEVLKMAKPPFVMDKWVVGIRENSIIDCVVNYESSVRSPRLTRHSHAVSWSPTGGRDEIKMVELVIETPSANMEGPARSRSNSDVDPRWMYKLRQRQLKSQSAQPPVTRPASSSTSDPNDLPHFLSAYGDQASSYAAAVRRSPNRRSPNAAPRWPDSRSSSPTADAAARLAPLHLGSKGSSPSSTTSESASERERPLSAGYHGHGYFGNTLTVTTAAGGDRWTQTRAAVSQSKSGRTPHHSGRPRSNSYGAAPQSRPRAIPGMAQSPAEERGGAKVGEGGWIKVERTRKSPRQESKQVRGRTRRGGPGGRGRS